VRGVKRLLLITLFFVGAVSSFGQTPAAIFDATTYRNGVGTRGTYGWEFTVQTPVRVTALGVLDSPFLAQGGTVGDGLNESHAVGIWRLLAQPTLIVATTVQSGIADALQNGFRYAPVAATDLPAGQYVIGMYNSGVQGDYSVLPSGSSPTFTAQAGSGLIIGNRRIGDNLSLGFPDIIDTSNRGDFGPNMLIQPVPEPSVAALSFAGVIGLALLKRKRN
jgi:hypothetical protein